MIKAISISALLVSLFLRPACSQERKSPDDVAGPKPSLPGTSIAPGDQLSNYRLGAEDRVTVHVSNEDEISASPYSIDLAGDLTLPRIGKIHAAGMNLSQLQAQLETRYKDYLLDPIVSVSVADYHSQPIYILGAVNNPGVHQIQGRKRLFEVVSEAGGLRQDAGGLLKLTRQKQRGPIPIAGSKLDATGDFYTADVNIHSVLEAKSPEDNVAVEPNDVITIPKAELIYVIGAVNRSGGFTLSEKSSMSVLQVVALAEGLKRTASSNKAMILREQPGLAARAEIPVDLKKIMKGSGADVPLSANDILFVPTSTAKSISIRAAEVLVTTGSGLAVYGRY